MSQLQQLMESLVLTVLCLSLPFIPTFQSSEGLIVNVGYLVIVEGERGKTRQTLEIPSGELRELVMVEGKCVQLVQSWCWKNSAIFFFCTVTKKNPDLTLKCALVEFRYLVIRQIQLVKVL